MSDYIRLTEFDAKQDKTKIATVIGDAYKQWQPMDIVSISSPTGSGKTYFILHVLLEWVINEDLHNHICHKIIYFVNRKILKKQIEDELNHEIQVILDQYPRRLHYSDYIQLFTYQEVQERIKYEGMSSDYKELPVPNHYCPYDIHPHLENYAFVIYDECHYYLADSIFNPETALGFRFLRMRYDMEVQIYMSATIDDIRKYLENQYDKSNMTVPNVMGAPHLMSDLSLPFATGIRVNYLNSWSTHYYSSPADYRLIKLHSIGDNDEIPYLLTNEKINGKWLVFVDDKDAGRKLCDSLDENDALTDRVIFLDAEYENREETSKSVDEIATEKASSKHVVICTSVLDNGVSFFDNELRNIVILTDMQDEFLQMLGRKRFDGNKVDLYICKRDSSFFSRRKNAVTVTRNVIDEYRSYIDTWNAPQSRQHLLNSILKNEHLCISLSKFCYSYIGQLFVSDFSVARLAKMEMFYAEMKSKLEEDEHFFLATQANWLGKSLDEVDRLHIKETPEWRQERIVEIVKELEIFAERKLDKTQNEALRTRIRKPLQELLKTANDYLDKTGKSEDEEIRTIGKDTISKNTFSRIARYFDLPFTMEKPDGSHFIIHRVADPNLTPMADSDLRDLRKRKKKASKMKS